MNAPLITDRPGRRSLRLAGYDYRQAGGYFITICTHSRQPLFGSIAEGEMQLNEAGVVARECWKAIPDHYPHARLDAFIIMPNHIHGVVFIIEPVGADDHVGANNYSPLQREKTPFRSPSQTIGAIVRGFKIGVTKWFRANTAVHTVWQRNYYEHVIRNEAVLQDVRAYIANNPAKWIDDPEYVPNP